jgi:hypothetical protein
MKSWKIIGIFIAIIALAYFILYMSYTPIGPATMKYNGPYERIAVRAASYNPSQNSVSVAAEAVDDFSSNAIFINIVFKDRFGSIVADIPVSYTLNGLELTTLSVNLNSTLTSGTYTVTLATAKGSSFVSPSFNVP